MAIKRVMIGGQLIAVDDSTGELMVKVSGVTLDADIDIGDVNLLNAAGAKINPATSDKQDTANSSLAAIAASATGTGLPIPLSLADPGNDNYSAALTPNPIARACARIRIIVGNSGCVISLDGGVTASITLPADYADDLAVAISANCDIRVKRLSAGTVITGLIVEVR